jgi:hypothetical protein
MRYLVSSVILLVLNCSTGAWAEDFLGAPVIPGGKTLKQTERRLEKAYNITYDDALNFYKEQFKDERDIKFRYRKHETYIEDDGNRPWHSITFSKADKPELIVIYAKDSWTWILGTLILRFLGVFVILVALYLGLALSDVFFLKSEKPGEGKGEPVKV